MTTTRKPTTKPRRAPARDVPQIRVTMHKAYWAFLWKQYAKADKFEIRDTDREPLAEVMHAVGKQSHLEGEITVWGPAHGFAILTQWMCREMLKVSPSLTKSAWVTCGMLVTPQVAAQDVGRGFEDQS